MPGHFTTYEGKGDPVSYSNVHVQVDFLSECIGDQRIYGVLDCCGWVGMGVYRGV